MLEWRSKCVLTSIAKFSSEISEKYKRWWSVGQRVFKAWRLIFQAFQMLQKTKKKKSDEKEVLRS